MRSKGLKGFDVEKFWRNWEEMAVWGRKDQERREASLSHETFMQEKWSRQQAKHKRIRNGARNDGVDFSMGLSLRPKSVSPTKQVISSGPAIFPGVSELKFNEDDDEMKM
jgi:hypothetical protein